MTLAERAMQHPMLAPIYERAWRPALFWAAMGFDVAQFRREKAQAVAALRLEPGMTVLDVACGPGNFTPTYAEAVGPSGKAVGLDLSRPMLQRALVDNAGNGASYVLGSAHDLPFGDGSLDAVVCYGALYLIPEAERAIDEMVRVVRPGGRLAVMTTVTSGLAPWRRVQAAVTGPTGLRMFGPDEVTGRLRAAGCTEVTREVHGALQYVAATAP